MGVLIGWSSSAGVSTPTTTIGVNADSGLLGPRSGDVGGSGGASLTTPRLGTPIYALVFGNVVTAGATFIVPPGWTQLHVYYSPNAPPSPCFQLLTANYTAGMTNPTVGGAGLSIQAVSMTPYVFGTGVLEVGTDSWGTPTTPGVSGLVTMGAVGAVHSPVTVGILVGRLNDNADFRDPTGTKVSGEPYLNGSSNRGIVAGWNRPDQDSIPGFVVGTGAGGPSEFCAYAVAFSDSVKPFGFTAEPIEGATRVKPEYRPLTYESGGCIVFV